MEKKLTPDLEEFLQLNAAQNIIFKFVIPALLEGLNGVNRQPSNGLKINRQPSKTDYFYRQPSNERAKISRQTSQISLNDRGRLT